MIGKGSVIVIIACTMISVGVILWLYFIQKKRDVKGENHLSKSNEKRE
jgi:cbb3-type cytochrome oxidase subunit 3